MKTFNILPWYFLLLILILCVAVMSTIEGMVSQKVVNSTTPTDDIVTMLKEKQKVEFPKKTSNYIVVILSDRYRNVNMTKLKEELDKMTAYTFLILVSKNSDKMNDILKEISMVRVYGTSNVTTLNVNLAYSNKMNKNKMFIAGSEAITKIIQNKVNKYNPPSSK